MKIKKIIENKSYSNLYGMNIVEIIVGDFSTRIAKWKDKKLFQLSLNTTPKCFLIDQNKDFKSVKDAKKYYLEGLKMLMEDTLELLSDIEYRT